MMQFSFPVDCSEGNSGRPVDLEAIMPDNTAVAPTGASSMRTTWTFHTAGQLLFGRHATQHLGDLAGRLGIRRVLLVTDPILVKAGLVESVHVPLSESGVV